MINLVYNCLTFPSLAVKLFNFNFIQILFYFVSAPKLVQDLIIPNPITKKMEYYNELTIELYEAIYDMIPYLQFKSYVLGQRVTRSKIKDRVSNIILKVDKMLDPNNKDGNAINVTKYSSALTSISVRDVHCIENTKLKVEKFLQELSDVKEIIEASRSSLFNEKMNVKSWKANELVFHEKQIEVIEEKVTELSYIHSKISANALTLKRKFPESITKSSETKRRKTRQAENKKKSETRKKKRLAIKCKEVCKIVAPHINFDEVAAKKVQVTEENLNKECASELSVRFHRDALKHSLENSYFDKRAEVFVKELLDNLESLKESRSLLQMARKKAKEEKDKSKQRTLFSCFQRKIETPAESSSSCEGSSSDSDCL